VKENKPFYLMKIWSYRTSVQKYAGPHQENRSASKTIILDLR
jgi:hypothetical protein